MTEYQSTRDKIIANKSNSLTDCVAANHAAIELVNSSWHKTLNELNCHLHPLDTIATKTRAALKQCEHNVAGKVWGKGCIAGNIVLQMNKMQYKNGKGDPRGFTTLIYNERLPCGIIPRYRGNRRHILFHICGIYVEHHAVLKMYLEKGTSCGGLRASI